MTSFLKGSVGAKKKSKRKKNVRLEAAFGSAAGLIQVDTVHEAITWLSVVLVSKDKITLYHLVIQALFLGLPPSFHFLWLESYHVFIVKKKEGLLFSHKQVKV